MDKFFSDSLRIDMGGGMYGIELFFLIVATMGVELWRVLVAR
jgi:hypothetical protein